jgi:SAM-dependent methyltransferase
MHPVSLGKSVVRRTLRALGLQLVRLPRGSYIDAKEIIAAADRDGVSVADYVASLWGDAEKLETTLNSIRRAVTLQPAPRILEIGAGTGRFLVPLAEYYNASACEVYEPNRGWADYLASHHRVIDRPSNGRDLSATPDGSCDIVMANGVFVYLPAMVSLGYFIEMMRVANDSAFIVFDVFTETEADVAHWTAARADFQVVLPRQAIIEVFARHGWRPIAEFPGSIPTGTGGNLRSRYFVFSRA